MSTTKIFGYFSEPDQELPEYDPGLEVDCPVCYNPLSRPVVTISLLVPGDNRSYFYRAHGACYHSLNETEQAEFDSVLVDAIAASKNVN